MRAAGVTQTFLSPARVEGLASPYEAGAKLVELDERFGVHRRTAAAHLVRRSVPIRWHGLDECNLLEAVELYTGSLNPMQVGLRFVVSQQMVRRALANVDIPIHASGRRARASE